MAEDNKEKKPSKQEKAIMNILKLLKENNLTIDVEHQIVIKPIKKSEEK